MSYKNEHIDYIFFRMRDCLPQSVKFYYIIVILKLAPLFLQVHSMGYASTPNTYATIHTYYRYLSLSFYIENSFDISSIIAIAGVFLCLNILLIVLLFFYLSGAKQVQNDDENYNSRNSLDHFFSIFSNIVFFKYVALCQFFYEINFLPFVCVSNRMDFTKMKTGNILNFKESSFESVCTGMSFTIFLLVSILNMIIDSAYHYLLVSRFFDFNVLSDYFWNSYPNFLHSFLFLEGLAQIFFIFFLNYENSFYKLIFGIYVYLLVVVRIYRFIVKKEFYSQRNKGVMKALEVVRTMIIMAQIIVQCFELITNQSPNDLNIVGMVIMEFIFSILIYVLIHKKDINNVSTILTENINRLNEKNIYSIFTYLITEFRIFSDVNYKFQEENLDLFLENYVTHLKLCEEYACPCKNYIKKVANSTNTLKTGYHTSINFTHLGNGNYQEEYILNKFFNVLSANVSTTIKYTNNNVNINNIKDSHKHKMIYNMRVRLINAVKKLISYRLEYLFTNLDTTYANNFSNTTKHFIRINYFSLHLLCNKSYYKTIFQFHEFLSEFQKMHGKNYQPFLIYYFYLKKFGIKEYNEYLTFLKSIKKDSNIFNLDFRTILSLCIKFYEIEAKLVENVKYYQSFISYFEKKFIEFNELLDRVKKFKSGYKSLTKYIRHFFKNDKINNLFVCSKIILYFKILQIDIPESIHNKLIVQSYDEDSSRSNNYIDSNYYLIANYIEGEFVIKFVSHELLIILEYSEEELREQDFHLLMPESMRSLHRHLTISEVKNKNNYNVQYKEIFLVSKQRSCILFDLHYKILLNLKGEITLLCVLNLKKPKNDTRTCFVCINDGGEVLAMNREFEEYLILSMKMLDYVRIDSEKIILQNLGNRIRSFFKDEENYNSEFFEKFDYEYYLSSLFGEEFEPLRDRNDTLFRKKYSKWESLRDVIKRGRYYNRFIDIYVRVRMLNKQNKIYFIKYHIKANLTVKSFEPYNTTLSLINAVKTSKREMAKLSFFKMDEVSENKSEVPNEEKQQESQDLLNESQSILSSAACLLKEKNSKRLFRARKSRFKLLPKSRNIFILTIFLGSLSLCSIIFNIVSLFTKFNMLTKNQQVMTLHFDVTLLKNSLYYLSSGIINLVLIQEKILPIYNINNGLYNTQFKSYPDNTVDLVKNSIDELTKIIYEINYLNNVYFNVEINDKLSSVNNNFLFLYNNGLIYKKGTSSNYTNLNVYNSLNNMNNVMTFKEVSTFHKSANIFVNNFKSQSQNLSFEKYILFNKIDFLQEDLTTQPILTDDDIFIFYIINNLYTQIEPFLTELETSYHAYQGEIETSVQNTMTIIKVFEFTIVVVIILIELVFIFLGYEKTKKKMKNLKKKVKENNVDLTLKKIEEFVKFCNTFNIYSLYLIADFELNPRKSIDDKDKPTTSSRVDAYSFRKKTKSREGTETSLCKVLNPSISNNAGNSGNSPGQEKENFTRTKSSEDKNPHDKSLMKLENIKKQRKQTAFYMKKDSQTSNRQTPDSENENWNNSEFLRANLEVPNEKLDNEISNIPGNNPNAQDNSEGSLKSDPKAAEVSGLNKNSIYQNKPHTALINSKRDSIKDNGYESSGTPSRIRGVLKKPTIPIQVTQVNTLANKDNNEGINFVNYVGNDVSKDAKLSIIYSNNNEANSLVVTIPQINVNYARTNSNKSVNEESNAQLILQNTEDVNSINLLRNANNSKGSNTNSKKIKWTHKNTKRFYSPDRGLTDQGTPSSKTLQRKVEKMMLDGDNNTGNKKEDKVKENDKSSDKLMNKSLVHDVTPFARDSNPLSQHINNNNTDVNENMNDENNETSAMNFSKSERVKNNVSKLDMTDLKEMNLKDYKKLNNPGVTTVKKKVVVDKAKDVKHEDIEEYVETLVHSNLKSKLILLSFGLAFFILYLINILFHFTSFEKISSLVGSTHVLLEKVSAINSLILKYKFNLISNSTDQDLRPQFDIIYANLNELILVKQSPEFNSFPLSYDLEFNINSKDTCSYLSVIFGARYNTTSEYEKNECYSISEQMNKNGFTEAYKNILNSMQQLNSDMLKLTDKSEEVILSKLMDLSFFDLIVDIDYTFHKYYEVLCNYVSVDSDNFYSSLKQNEDIFSYSSIVLNVVFAIVSLTFIIFPIKYVEIVISWLINKLVRT